MALLNSCWRVKCRPVPVHLLLRAAQHMQCARQRLADAPGNVHVPSHKLNLCALLDPDHLSGCPSATPHDPSPSLVGTSPPPRPSAGAVPSCAPCATFGLRGVLQRCQGGAGAGRWGCPMMTLPPAHTAPTFGVWSASPPLYGRSAPSLRWHTLRRHGGGGLRHGAACAGRQPPPFCLLRSLFLTHTGGAGGPARPRVITVTYLCSCALVTQCSSAPARNVGTKE